MIRNISIQDVVSKRTTKGGRIENETPAGSPARRERDYLIERLTRKHTATSIVDSPVKIKKTQSTRSRNSDSGDGKSTKKWFWYISPLVLIGILFVVLQLMVSASVSIKLKQASVPINTKISASMSATTSPTALTYQIITLSSVDSEIVVATSTVPSKPKKASGQITIFNNFSSAPQTLVKSTRFETADGLIYRIPNTINVPGYTTSAGKTVPGSITVTVTADQVGSKYNIDMADFTVPGFKTDASRYAKIFARSKTAMTGGADQNSAGVSEDAKKVAQTNIESRLKESLLKQVQAQKTANSIVFDGASKFSSQQLSDTAGTDSQHTVIREQGTISSVIFDKKILGKILLSDAIAKVGGSAEIRGLENLHFVADTASASPVWQVKPLSFNLTGTVDVIGVVDTAKLLKDILGTPRSDLTKVLSNYPTIDKATANVKPFWKGSFPTDASRVKVEIIK